MSGESTAVTSALSIASDLALFAFNYGLPNPTAPSFFREESGLALAGTTAGIAATSVQAAVSSSSLTNMVEGLSTDYDKRLARVVIATSAINTKMLTQVGVSLAYALLVLQEGQRSSVLSSYATKMLLPSLVINGAIAGVLPYVM
jgi:TRAP-type mannitol/chloroaromatic compound transport system permease large subunit